MQASRAMLTVEANMCTEKLGCRVQALACALRADTCQGILTGLQRYGAFRMSHLLRFLVDRGASSSSGHFLIL